MAGVKISFLGTGAGASIHAAHTAIVLDSPDGTKVLLDASSGNSVFRNSASIGMAPEQFRHVLLSHDHADHMLGLPLIQLVHSRADPDGPPLEVHQRSFYSRNRTVNMPRHNPGTLHRRRRRH